jgi:LemA protein
MEIIKKFWWIGALAILVFWVIGSYNGIAAKDQVVKKTWGDVESDYQRRSDLIPNLVNTVKGYAIFEQKTLVDVTQARASATQMKIDPTNLTPEKLAEFQKAQSGLSSAIGRLLVVSENYPELKANQNFLDLQAQLEGTENRISVSRKRFNEAVQLFNTAIVGFPGNLVAKLGGFTEKGFFKAAEGADKAPEVKF